MLQFLRGHHRPNESHAMIEVMENLAEIAALIRQHTPRDGFHATRIERVTLVRSSTVTLPMPNVYRPQMCLVVQGQKRVTVGDQIFGYAPGMYGLVTHDVPAVGTVTEATRNQPYLCLYLSFDAVMLGQLAMRIPTPTSVLAASIGKTVSPADASLLEATVRLLRLLNEPAAIPVLAPLAEQEILYRLLAGANGFRMRQITASQGQLAQIGRAIAWITQNFREKLNINELAEETGMSSSSLHEHFRRVTGMTPLQFQKQLRLQDARSLMLIEDMDATTAAFCVGYESASQFNREYRRHFGEPPARDIASLRGVQSVARTA